MFNQVLLVEDDPSHAMLIKRAMREFAGEIVHAESVEAAFLALENIEPELIISDLRLPDSSGVDHIGALRERSNDAPIVVLTSSTSLDDAISALKLGARDFIVKNFNSEFRSILTLSLSRLFANLEIEKEKKQLTHALELLRIAIENSSEALAVVKKDLSIDYSNSAFKNLSLLMGGLPTSLREAFSKAPGLTSDFISLLEAKCGELAPGAVWHSEFSLKVDPERNMALSLSAVRGEGEDSDNERVLWITDITEQRRRERFQREILSTTTHDLKGPISAITVSVELLERTLKDPSREREIALRIGSAAQGVLNLIDEFLSARRIQEGSLLLRPKKQDVIALIKDVVGDYESIATARKIELCNQTGDQEILASVERAGFGRVLGNLLGNALKFTPEKGRVTINIKKEADGLHLLVQDTGCGMEASDVQRIFERFSRLEKHSEVAGSGLGLFVVKSIVNAYGGKIEVTSQLNSGTTFDVFFPENPPINERGELISLDFG
ncbi:MAG: hybrid sensor histidine kinase/response regulator [SAR324 cluster bacterium]|uniref:histidine kinase n=1 Tax=SAR324 cluster bacterium TaxID=2024889 RepID=A0A7X9FTV7_9DELT|nr:hybrid sensor histidine kinase/response regulator [SAR324 cluster bacterium]